MDRSTYNGNSCGNALGPGPVELIITGVPLNSQHQLTEI